MITCLKPGERIDDLQRDGLMIIQNPRDFCFGMDAVLLADFAVLRPHDRVADFGTGTGILSLLMSRNEPTATFYALDIQDHMAEMTRRSVTLNGLDGRISVYHADFRTAYTLFGRESMDTVVCNPPYGKQRGTLHSNAKNIDLARHEGDCSIEEVCQSCASVLKNHGRLYMVFPSERFLELCDALRACDLEPKEVRFVCSKVSKPPYLVLVRAVKNAKPSILWHPPLVVYDESGNETPELRRIYHQNP